MYNTMTSGLVEAGSNLSYEGQKQPTLMSAINDLEIAVNTLVEIFMGAIPAVEKQVVPGDPITHAKNRVQDATMTIREITSICKGIK